MERAAARRPELKAMVGFVRRFDPSYQDAAAKLAQGLVGQPYLLRSQTCDLNDDSGFFVQFAPSSGGIFMDCSIHDIDLARWLLARRARCGCGPAASTRCTARWRNTAMWTTAWRCANSRAASWPASTPRAPRRTAMKR